MKHKVLFDGNGSSLIRVVGLGDYVPVAEAQALAAQVEAKDKEIEKVKAVTMRLAKQSGILASVSEQLKVFCKNLAAGNIPEFHKAEALRQAISYEDALIKQHLAEIRAKVGRAGFVAGFKLGIQTQKPAPDNCASAIDFVAYRIEKFANIKAHEYADSIRQGEVEW